MSLKSELVYYSKKCYRNRFLAATDGNLSTRTAKNTVISTATGICKEFITINDIVEVDLDLKKISGKKLPSSELKLHIFIYRSRKDVNAVIHTHPIFATAFASSGQALDKYVFPEIILNIEKVPLAKYACPSTDEVPRSIAKFIKESKAILLANHGLVAFGKDLEEAYYITEKVERSAEILFYARMLGGENELTKEQVEQLKRIWKRS